jgi:hypothetical protein
MPTRVYSAGWQSEMKVALYTLMKMLFRSEELIRLFLREGRFAILSYNSMYILPGKTLH